VSTLSGKRSKKPFRDGGGQPALDEKCRAEPRFDDLVPVSPGIVVLLVGVILIDRVAVLRGARELNVALEEARQDGVGIGRVAQHRVAVREVDPHRWELVARMRRLDERRVTREQAGPRLRVLRARDLARLPVSHCVRAVADDPTLTHLDTSTRSPSIDLTGNRHSAWTVPTGSLEFIFPPCNRWPRRERSSAPRLRMALAHEPRRCHATVVALARRRRL
jgi:hypothetical protein